MVTSLVDPLSRATPSVSSPALTFFTHHDSHIVPILSESNPSVIAPKTKVDSTKIVTQGDDKHKHHRRILDGDILGGPIVSGNSIGMFCPIQLMYFTTWLTPVPILSESNPTVVAGKTNVHNFEYYELDGKVYKHEPKKDDHKKDDHKHHRRILDGDILGGPILSGNSILPILSESNPTVVAGKTNINNFEYYEINGQLYRHNPKDDHKKGGHEKDEHKHHRRILDGDIAGGPILSGNSILPILSESNPTVVAGKTEVDNFEYYEVDGKIYKHDGHKHHRRIVDGDVLGGPIVSGNSIIPILSASNPTVIAGKTTIDSTKIAQHHRRILDGDILGGPILSGNSILPILSESNPSVIAPKTKVDSTKIVELADDKHHHHHRRILDGDIAGGPILSGNSILPILSESSPTVVTPKTNIDSTKIVKVGHDEHAKDGHKHHRRILDGDILGGPILSGNSILPILSESNPTVIAGKTNIDSTQIVDYRHKADGHKH